MIAPCFQSMKSAERNVNYVHVTFSFTFVSTPIAFYPCLNASTKHDQECL